ncbi:MAG TPA: thioesterase family protein, partial [Ktedonobacterales bacterium]
ALRQGAERDRRRRGMALAVGMRGEASLVVDEARTAEAVGAGGVRVFGTPAMIALMENAAWRLVQPELEAGETTVGTAVEIRHLAATPVGMRVTATAELIEIEGRRLVFRVAARDERGPIGEGRHERMRVQLDRFLARLGEAR